MHELSSIEEELKKNLAEFESYYVKASEIDKGTRHNNQLIIPQFISLITQGLKPLQFLLQFFTDEDILALAATCRTLYRIFYSPFGFWIMRHLRPVVITKSKKHFQYGRSLGEEQQMPVFSQATVKQLCYDPSLKDVDEDDKQAILETMATNILATKQKIKELNIIVQIYNQKSERLLERVMYISAKREEQQKKISSIHDQIEKLKELLRTSEGHAGSLREEQERMEMERQTRMLVLNEQKSKLERQKDLLIKKIKSQQKQKEEGMIYAREVNRVLKRLSQITQSSSSSKIKEG